MKHRRNLKRAGNWVSPYHEVIQRVTGAPIGDVPRIENIMREEVFHSTLDWQTEEQLAVAARQAQRRLHEDREMYDLDLACRQAMLQVMRAEAALGEQDAEQNRAAVERAKTEYEAARERLFGCLEATVNH